MDTDKFAEIEKTYLDSVDLIRQLCSVLHGEDAHKILNSTVSEYNTIVQCALLYAAMENNIVEADELQFIKNIDDDDDLLDAVNSMGRRKYFAKWKMISWDSLDSLNGTRDIVRPMLKKAISSVVMNLCGPFAKIDKDIESKDYGVDIRDAIKLVVEAFVEGTSEGDTAADQAAIANTMKDFDDTFLLTWDVLTRQAGETIR